MRGRVWVLSLLLPDGNGIQRLLTSGAESAVDAEAG